MYDQVGPGVRRMEIGLRDGTTIPAIVTKSNPAEDVAVLAAGKSAAPGQPAILDDSNRLAVGDPIVARGMPAQLPRPARSAHRRVRRAPIARDPPARRRD